MDYEEPKIQIVSPLLALVAGLLIGSMLFGGVQCSVKITQTPSEQTSD